MIRIKMKNGLVHPNVVSVIFDTPTEVKALLRSYNGSTEEVEIKTSDIKSIEERCEEESLYLFSWDCGRMGTVESVFVAKDSEVQAAIGKRVSFGEILGKHSDVYGTLEWGDLERVQMDQRELARLKTTIGRTWSGYNPLDYLDEVEDMNWEDE